MKIPRSSAKYISCFMIILMNNLTACAQKDLWIEDIPDPEKYFSEVSIGKYEMEDYSVKGYHIKADDSIQEEFSSYVNACEKLDVWTDLFYEDEKSWSYYNSDKSRLISIDYYEDQNKITIEVREFE